MRKMYAVLLTWLLHVAVADIVVNTTTGPIRGVASLVDGVEAFLSIPYAEPPIENLRFAKPVPKKPWQEIYNASRLPPPCSQVPLQIHYEYFMPDISNMSEDCLYLNVWMPKSKPTDGLRPVIIFIHPGLFVVGSSNLKAFDGSKLASHGDLVVATINYRLGAFGYLVSFTEDAPGNMGQHDQFLAMKWMKENAEAFGSNPENIVLMGSSAGAYSIAGHILSPRSKNLFKRAITHSGGIVHPYFEDNNDLIYKHSQMVASISGCENETVTLKSDPYPVIACLKRKPKEAILEAEAVLSKSNPLTFLPRVYDDYLPKSVDEIIRSGNFRNDVEVLTGINTDEGTLMLTIGIPEYFGHYGRNSVEIPTKTRAMTMIGAVLMLIRQNNRSEISEFYINRVKTPNSAEYTKMEAAAVGDFVVACSTVFTADMFSLNGIPVYFYELGFRAASTPMADWIGTTHADEIQYVFGNPYHENFTDEEMEFSRLLMDRWTAFARTGSPNIPGHLPWFQYKYQEPLYMYFGQEEESIRMNPSETCEIWRKKFKADIDADFIRFLRNSGMNKTMEDDS